MRIAKIALAAAAIAASTAMPASADPTFETGVNTGDAGFVSVTLNTGLAASRSADSPDQGVLDAKCSYEQINTPNSGYATLVIAGYAAASPQGTNRAVATSLKCVIKNYYTGATVYEGTAANESTAAINVPTPPTVQSAAWIVCTETKALYANGAFVTTERLHCINPF
ncbi:MAG TPA: hypothetical protein VNQ77_09015 [Frankiaceae bacterium]|nr:hypothetical protein [Frankiaceae bacterium]